MLDELPADHDIDHLQEAIKIMDDIGCKFRTCVEGGAHQGIWTKILLDKFDVTHAFEPCEANYNKLRKALAGTEGSLVVSTCALGKDEGRIGLSPGSENTGQYHAVKGDSISCMPLDAIKIFKDLDFIKLDVEGYELFALEGAKKNIEKNGPFIMVELNGLSNRYGHHDQEVRDWLESRGYKEVKRWNKDYLFSL